jgi:hypothetical protein
MSAERRTSQQGCQLTTLWDSEAESKATFRNLSICDLSLESVRRALPTNNPEIAAEERLRPVTLKGCPFPVEACRVARRPGSSSFHVEHLWNRLVRSRVTYGPATDYGKGHKFHGCAVTDWELGPPSFRAGSSLEEPVELGTAWASILGIAALQGKGRWWSCQLTTGISRADEFKRNFSPSTCALDADTFVR